MEEAAGEALHQEGGVEVVEEVVLHWQGEVEVGVEGVQRAEVEEGEEVVLQHLDAEEVEGGEAVALQHLDA